MICQRSQASLNPDHRGGAPRALRVVRMGPDSAVEREPMAGPRLYQPIPPLADYVEFIGHWRRRGSDYRGRALPRGAVTIIFDVGHRQRLDFYAADGKTRLSVPPAFITGSHTVSYVSDITADEPVMAVHFRPGGAYPFFGKPLCQAHLVREFRSFTGMTPTQYRQRRIVLPSHVPVERHKYPRLPASASA